MANLIDVSTIFSKENLTILEYLQFLADDKITLKGNRKTFLQAIYYNKNNKCLYATNSKCLLKFDISKYELLVNELEQIESSYFQYSKGILKALDSEKFSLHPKEQCERVIPITEKSDKLLYPRYNKNIYTGGVSSNNYMNYYYFISLFNTFENRLDTRYFEKLNFKFEVIGRAGISVFGKNNNLEFVLMPYRYNI